MNDALTIVPICLVGCVYSIAIAYTVSMRMWAVVAFLFCYGLTLLGARLAQLISRR